MTTPASPTLPCPHCGKAVRLRRRVPAQQPRGVGAATAQQNHSALTGPDGPAAGGLLDLVRGHAARVFAATVGPAVGRLVGSGAVESATSLLTPAETAELAEWFAAAIGTAELLGRARVRLRVAAAGTAAYAEYAFNPDQPRDAHGRWIPGLPADDAPRTRANRRVAAARFRGAAAHVTAEQKQSLARYLGPDGNAFELNRRLRTGAPLAAPLAAEAEHLSAAIRSAPRLADPATVYRRIDLMPDREAELLGRYAAAAASGEPIRLGGGFVSTTTDPLYAAGFNTALPGGIVYEIAAHRGLPVRELAGEIRRLQRGSPSGFAQEHEVLLDRGSGFHVVGIKNVRMTGRLGLGGRVVRVVQLEQLDAGHAERNRDSRFATYAEAAPRASFADLARVTPSDPQSALDYFTALVPEFAGRLGRFVERVTRKAFRLAVEAGETLLAKVKEMFRAADAAGDPLPDAAEILDRLGVTAANSSYADLAAHVVFTEAFHDGGSRELARADAADSLPAWRYHATIRPTSRPHHAERDGWIYPASTFFSEIRGTEISETAGCLCSFSPLSAPELQAALAAGARWAPGYEGGA